jgi:hypothetical protein
MRSADISIETTNNEKFRYFHLFLGMFQIVPSFSKVFVFAIFLSFRIYFLLSILPAFKSRLALKLISLVGHIRS